MSSSVLKTHAHPHSHEFEKNARRIVGLLTETKNEEEQIRQAGGPKAIDAQHKKGRLTARYAVMSGDSAAGTLVEIKIKQLERERNKLNEKEKKELYESVSKTYEHQTDPRYAAARLWVDAIIDPAHTREALIWALEAAALNPQVREFKTGVLQT